MKKRIRYSGQMIWECNRATHRPSVIHKGFKSDTFFENSNLIFKQVFKLSYLWAMNHPVEYAEYETGMAHRHVIAWYKKFRRVCERYFRANPIRIRDHFLTPTALFRATFLTGITCFNSFYL